MTEGLVKRAALVAEELLRPVGRRWPHSRCVARAVELLPMGEATDAVTAAGWLHDVGYAPPVVESGFHPLDGARYLKNAGWPDLVVSLVAHHSGADIEAEERGLSDQLDAFARPDEELLDCLTFADMTSSPDGERLPAGERLAEILRRYPEGDPVHRAVTRSQPALAAAVRRTIERFGLPDEGF